MRKFLIYLSGARPDILRQCPTENARFERLGAAVLVASVSIAVGFAYALTQSVGLNPVVAVVIACILSLGTLSMDRVLVTMTTRGSGRIFSALPRILIAVLLGGLIGYGVALGLFRPQIAAQITVIKERAITAFAAQQTTSSLGNQITRLQAEYSGLTNIIGSGGATQINPAKDPQLTAFNAQLVVAQKQEVADFNAWQCELYGASPSGGTCSSGLAGNGPIAKADEQRYQNDVNLVAQLRAEINNREHELTSSSASAQAARLAQAKEELPAIRLELESAQTSQENQAKQFYAATQEDNGLLIRLQALGELRASDSLVGTVTFLLIFLASFISSLPVLIRVLQRAGIYEEILALTDRQALARARYRLLSVGQTTLEQVLDSESIAVEASAPPAETRDETPGPRTPVSLDELDGALRGMRDMRSAGYSDHEPAARHETAN